MKAISEYYPFINYTKSATMREKKILFSACLALILSGYNGNNAVAQTNGVKYEQVIKSKPLTKVLKELEERFNSKIVFSYDDLSKYKVTATVKANNLNSALNQVLVGLPVSYTQKNGVISVRVNPSQLTPSGQSKHKVTVSGKVLDSKGEPIPAATVTLKGKAGIGTVTDYEGNFTMDLDKGKGETLLVSFLGMKSTSYYVNCQKNAYDITLTLTDDDHFLDEVVVTGYQTISKERATGSFGTVTSKQ